MSPPPAVSVVIPAYNRAATLPRALASVRAQDFADLEILVVDDGSTDDTDAVLRAFGEPRLRVFRHEVNRGEAAARTTGVAESRGALLAWLDSDDEWLPGKLAAQVALLGARPELDAACTGFFAHESGDPAGRLVVPDVPESPEAWRRTLLMGCDVGFGTTVVVRRAAALAVGPFDEAMIRHTDWDWLLRFSRGHALGLIAAPLARVHVEPGQVDPMSAELSARRFIEKHQEEFRALGPRARRRAIAKRWLEVARLHLLGGNRAAGARFLLRALATHPGQRPGLYLQVFDAALGTALAPAAARWRRGRTPGAR